MTNTANAPQTLPTAREAELATRLDTAVTAIERTARWVALDGFAVARERVEAMLTAEIEAAEDAREFDGADAGRTHDAIAAAWAAVSDLLTAP